MKVFKMRDSDGGRPAIVVAKDILTAINLYRKSTYGSCDPEWVEELICSNILIEDSNEVF